SGSYVSLPLIGCSYFLIGSLYKSSIPLLPSINVLSAAICPFTFNPCTSILKSCSSSKFVVICVLVILSIPLCERANTELLLPPVSLGSNPNAPSGYLGKYRVGEALYAAIQKA